MVKPGYKQTEVGVIPEEWEVCAWEAAGSCFSSGATPCRAISRYFDGEIKWVSSGELNHNIIIDTLEHISKEAQEENNLVIHPANTFLMAITGLEAAGTRGSCAILGVPATTNQSCMAVYGTEKLDVKYLFYYYSAKGDDLAFKYCQGTKQQSYTAGIVKKLPIILPPIDEQKKIAAALSDVDKLINTLNRQYAKKKAIKQGAMQELLTGKKRLPGFSGEWQRIRIGSMTAVFSGGTPNTSEPLFWGGTIPWMNSGELNLKIVRQVQGRITKAGMDSSSTHFVPAECVLIGLAGQGKTRGTAAFNTFPLCTNQSIAAIYPNPEKFNSKFLYYKMDTQYEKLRELSSGDGGRGGLNKKLILDYEVAIPKSVDEQAAIATVLTEMDDEIENTEKKLAKYRQVKQGMMQQLLAGNIRLV